MEIKLGYLYIHGDEDWIVESFSHFKLAIQELNADPEILPDHVLNFSRWDSRGNEIVALEGAIKLVEDGVVGIVGTGLSGALPAASVFCSMKKVPILSPGSTFVDFADKERFPYLLRSRSSDMNNLKGMAIIPYYLGFRRVAVLVSDYMQSGWNLGLRPAADALGLSYLPLVYHDKNGTAERNKTTEAFSLVKNAGHRVIIVHARLPDMEILDDITKSLHMRDPRYVYILRGGNVVEGWASSNNLIEVGSMPTPDNLVEKNFLTRWPSVSTIWHSQVHGIYNATTGMPFFDMTTVWDAGEEGIPDSWGKELYDAVWTYGRALHALIIDGGFPTDGAALRLKLRETDFLGITGRVKFDPDSQDRVLGAQAIMHTDSGNPVVFAMSTEILLTSSMLNDQNWCEFQADGTGCFDLTPERMAQLPWATGEMPTDGRLLDVNKTRASVGASFQEGSEIVVIIESKNSFGEPTCGSSCTIANSTGCAACQMQLEPAAYFAFAFLGVTGIIAPARDVSNETAGIVITDDPVRSRFIVKFPYGLEGAGNQDRTVDLSITFRGYALEGGPYHIDLISTACKTGEAQVGSGQSVSCSLCLAGTFNSVRGARNCSICPPGTYQNGVGKSACAMCPSGKYQSSTGYAASEGSVECEPCEVGKYQPYKGRTTCFVCADYIPGSTTRLLGATDEAECVCPRGTFYADNATCPGGVPLCSVIRLPAFSLVARCMPCTPYMETCDGAKTRPLQMKGFFLQGHSSGVFRAYRCSSVVACPGGEIGSCPHGSSGLVCSICDKGSYFWNGESCVKCNVFQMTTFYFIVVLAVPLIVILLHSIANDPIKETVASSGAMLTLLGLSMTVLLCLSAFATINITWVEPVITLLSWSRFLLLDLSFFTLACSFSASPIADYIAVSCLPSVVAVGCTVVGLLRLAERCKLVNTFSNFFNGLYLLLVMHALEPLRFLVHPSGEKSVLSIPYMLAGSSEHMVMVGIGILNLFCYCVTFLAVCAWAAWAIRARSGKKRAELLITFRFLFFKFRPQTFYWGLPLLVRNAVIAIVPSFWPELPHVQLFILVSIAATSLVATSFAMPFRVAWMNYLDIAMFFVLLLMLVLGGILLPGGTGTAGVLASFVVTAFALILLVVFVAFLRIVIRLYVVVRRDRSSVLEELGNRDSAYEEQLLSSWNLDEMWTDEYDKAVADVFEELSESVQSSLTSRFLLVVPDLHDALLDVAATKVEVRNIAAIAAKIRRKDYSLRLFYNDVVKTFPELKLFQEEAAPSRLSSGLTYHEEFLRTIGAFFAVYWICRLDIDGREGLAFGVDTDEETVIGAPEGAPEDVNRNDSNASQERVAWVKMTSSQRRIHFYRNFDWSLLNSLVDTGLALPAGGLDMAADGRLVALLALTAFHDIMKIEQLCPIVAGAPYGKYPVGTKINDHDAALAYILDRHPETLPSFMALSHNQQRIIRFTLSRMDFNAGWLVQAEGPPSCVLGGLKQAIQGASSSEADVIFYFCHWLTDLAGAEPTPYSGSEKLAAKFPPLVLQSLLECTSVVQTLAVRGAAEVYEEYLVNRWRRAAAELGPEPLKIDRIAKLRLHCMAQAGAKCVISALDDLIEEDWLLLVHELGFTGLRNQMYSGSDVRLPDEDSGEPFLLYYGPAWVQRAGVQDPVLTLRVLAEVFRACRNAWPHRQKTSVDEANPVTRIVRVDLLKQVDISEMATTMSSKDSVSNSISGHRGCVFVVDAVNDLEGILKMAPDTDYDVTVAI